MPVQIISNGYQPEVVGEKSVHIRDVPQQVMVADVVAELEATNKLLEATKKLAGLPEGGAFSHAHVHVSRRQVLRAHRESP